MVGMQSQRTLCDAGVPVVDDNGMLMAIGAPRETSDGEYLTRLIDVRAVGAVLKNWLAKSEARSPKSETNSKSE
jgi:hypothetical protein